MFLWGQDTLGGAEASAPVLCTPTPAEEARKGRGAVGFGSLNHGPHGVHDGVGLSGPLLSTGASRSWRGHPALPAPRACQGPSGSGPCLSYAEPLAFSPELSPRWQRTCPVRALGLSVLGASAGPRAGKARGLDGLGDLWHAIAPLRTSLAHTVL